jgi:hypothetical protein
VTKTQLDLTIPTKPAYSETVTQTSLGTIGVMISGARLFNDYEDPQRSLVALDNNYSIGGVYFIDACNAHTAANGGQYHYHGVPYCITDELDTPGEHSKMLGFLRDGFPVYGEFGEGGKKVTGADLDECNGHIGPTPEFPNGIYHYHLKSDASPYTPNCYHGTVDANSVGDGSPGGGGPPGGGQGGQGGPPPGGGRPAGQSAGQP